MHRYKCYLLMDKANIEKLEGVIYENIANPMPVIDVFCQKHAQVEFIYESDEMYEEGDEEDTALIDDPVIHPIQLTINGNVSVLSAAAADKESIIWQDLVINLLCKPENFTSEQLNNSMRYTVDVEALS